MDVCVLVRAIPDIKLLILQYETIFFFCPLPFQPGNGAIAHIIDIQHTFPCGDHVSFAKVVDVLIRVAVDLKLISF